MLAGAAEFDYRPTFGGDAAIFFADALPGEALAKGLREHLGAMERALRALMRGGL